MAGAKKEGRSSSRSGHARDRGLGYRLRDTGQVAEKLEDKDIEDKSEC